MTALVNTCSLEQTNHEPDQVSEHPVRKRMRTVLAADTGWQHAL